MADGRRCYCATELRAACAWLDSRGPLYDYCAGKWDPTRYKGSKYVRREIKTRLSTLDVHR